MSLFYLSLMVVSLHFYFDQKIQTMKSSIHLPLATFVASLILVAPLQAFAQAAALDAVEASDRKLRQAREEAENASPETKLREETKHFAIVAPGVVKDNRTGLQWMRCSLGQDWDETSKSCNGSVRTFNHEDALAIAKKLNQVGGYAGKTNWRLPTVRELQSLRFCSNGFSAEQVYPPDGKGSVPRLCKSGHTQPTIATTIFPDMESGKLWYWTSSARPETMNHPAAWDVIFLNGDVDLNYTYSKYAVRLVR